MEKIFFIRKVIFLYSSAHKCIGGTYETVFRELIILTYITENIIFQVWGQFSVGLQMKRDGTRWPTGGEVKGKQANGVGSQYSSHYMVYPALLPLMRTPQLPVVDWTDAPADLNGLVRLSERQNLVSARVPSHFNWPLPQKLLCSVTESTTLTATHPITPP